MARKKDDKGVTLMDSYKYNYELDLENTNDLGAVIQLGIQGIQNYNISNPPKYEDSPKGLQDFKEKVIEYLRYVEEINSNEDLEKKVVVDIEGMCGWCGISRQTFSKYAKRGYGWSEFIEYIKTQILAFKKQLAFTNKTPPIFAIFDIINNGDGEYVNTSQIEVKPSVKNEEIYYLPNERVERLKLEYGKKFDKDNKDNDEEIDIPDITDLPNLPFR